MFGYINKKTFLRINTTRYVKPTMNNFDFTTTRQKDIYTLPAKIENRLT